MDKRCSVLIPGCTGVQSCGNRMPCQDHAPESAAALLDALQDKPDSAAPLAVILNLLPCLYSSDDSPSEAGKKGICNDCEGEMVMNSDLRWIGKHSPFGCSVAAAEHILSAAAPRQPEGPQAPGWVTCRNGYPSMTHDGPHRQTPECVSPTPAPKSEPEGPQDLTEDEIEIATHLCGSFSAGSVSSMFERMLAEVRRHRAQPQAHAQPADAAPLVADLRETLDRVKAALGDRLLGKGPLSKEYAHGIMRAIDVALERSAEAAKPSADAASLVSNTVAQVSTKQEATDGNAIEAVEAGRQNRRPEAGQPGAAAQDRGLQGEALSAPCAGSLGVRPRGEAARGLDRADERGSPSLPTMRDAAPLDALRGVLGDMDVALCAHGQTHVPVKTISSWIEHARQRVAALAAASRDERRMTKHQRDWLAEAQLDLRTFGQHKGWCAILPVDSCEDCNCGLQSAHVRAAAALTADAAAAPRDRPDHPYMPAPMHDSGDCFKPLPGGRCGLAPKAHSAAAPRDERAQGFAEAVSEAVRIVEERGSQFESASYLADRFRGLASALRCLAPAASWDERSDALWQLKRVTDYLDSANILLRDANPEDAEECDEAAAVVAEARAYLDAAAAPLGAPVSRLDERLGVVSLALHDLQAAVKEHGWTCATDTGEEGHFNAAGTFNADNCPMCLDVEAEADADLKPSPEKQSPAPSASLEVEALREAASWMEAIQIRCREGDPKHDWRPDLDRFATSALAALTTLKAGRR